ncbi:hypothetical protein MRX96_017211 [Rhipicephalus microplus]
MISPATASETATSGDDRETVADRYFHVSKRKNKGEAPPENREKTEALPDIPESSAEETTTSVPKARSTKGDVESATEEENQSETHTSKTTSEKTTRAVAKSRPPETPFVTKKETTAGSRTREGFVTRTKDAAETAKGMLLCTAGDFAVEKDMFPTDGLCELLFYTDVRFLGDDFRGRYNEKSWRTFRRLAPASRKTGFGMSIKYDAKFLPSRFGLYAVLLVRRGISARRFSEADDVRKAMSSTGRKKLLQLYKGKIRHHGILRATCDSKTLKSDLTDKLRLINELKEFQNNLHGSQTGSVSTPELVLGIRFSDYLDEAEVAHHPHLPISILVVQTHIDRRVGSVPVIGTLLGKLEGTRGKSMNVPTLTNAISSLKAANITGDVRVLLSFTMIVGHFHLNHSFSLPARPSTNWEAMSWTMDGFQKTCKNNATFDVVGDGILRYEGIKGTEVFCFEDISTITQKVSMLQQVGGGRFLTLHPLRVSSNGSFDNQIQRLEAANFPDKLTAVSEALLQKAKKSRY